MSASFQGAIGFLLENEKGFVDDPKDAGGATNFGVTAATLSRWRGVAVSAADVRTLTRGEAEQIYFHWYWLRAGCDKLTSPLIASILLDAAALFGVGPATLYAQKAAVELGAAGLRLDGHAGPATAAALNSLDPQAFAATFHDLFRSRIGAIVQKRPESQKFRRGWETRVDKYLSRANENNGEGHHGI